MKWPTPDPSVSAVCRVAPRRTMVLDNRDRIQAVSTLWGRAAVAASVPARARLDPRQRRRLRLAHPLRRPDHDHMATEAGRFNAIPAAYAAWAMDRHHRQPRAA